MYVKAYIGKDAACNETLTFKNSRFTLQAGLMHVLTQLSPAERLYAGSSKRGEYRGFAALHDFCDANMLLPGTDCIDNVEECMRYWDRVMDLVTGYLIARYESSGCKEFTLDEVRAGVKVPVTCDSCGHDKEGV